MANLETQVVKIQLGNVKLADTYVFVLAEKGAQDDSELYVICELPLLNPAAVADCEHIAESIAGCIRRAYRRPVNDSTFENALAQTNDELGKLASLGKAHWVGKLNALIATKVDHTLNIATTGKITALLLRDNKFTSIAESPETFHPLKTFENFASGKLKLHDTVIFSTNQMFNHLSVDRLKNILTKEPLPEAAEKITEILQDNADHQVSFGTIIAVQEEAGPHSDALVEIEKIITPLTTSGAIWQSSLNFLKQAGEGLAALPQKIWLFVRQLIAKRPTAQVSRFIPRNREMLGAMNQKFRQAKNQISMETFRNFSRTKKFFFISAAILLLVVIANLIITIGYKKIKAADLAFQNNLTEVQQLTNDATAAFLYNDQAKAYGIVQNINSKLHKYSPRTDQQKQNLQIAETQAADLTKKLEKIVEIKANTLATLSDNKNLITLPNFLATEVNRNIISYNKTTGSVQDSALKASEPIVRSAFVKNNLAAIYNGKELFTWDFTAGRLSIPFSENVPNEQNSVGLRGYAVNSRVYLVDKPGGRILSFLVSDKGLSKPVVSVTGQDMSGALDLAVDGNIYILSGKGISKFQSGRQVDFNRVFLPQEFKADSKIYTENGFGNLYILDSGNKKIFITDKKGNLVKTITSPELTSPTDFAVDEKGKTIYVLNAGTLLKLNF